MRLAILVDIIAIAARIPIILAAVDRRTEHAAQDRAGDRPGRRIHARNDLPESLMSTNLLVNERIVGVLLT